MDTEHDTDDVVDAGEPIPVQIPEDMPEFECCRHYVLGFLGGFFVCVLLVAFHILRINPCIR